MCCLFDALFLTTRTGRIAGIARSGPLRDEDFTGIGNRRPRRTHLAAVIGAAPGGSTTRQEATLRRKALLRLSKVALGAVKRKMI